MTKQGCTQFHCERQTAYGGDSHKKAEAQQQYRHCDERVFDCNFVSSCDEVERA